MERGVTSHVLTDIGTVYTGDIDEPVVDGDAIVVRDGKIDRICRTADLDADERRGAWTCAGMSVMPGLVDCHVHPLIGDWTSRFGIVGWLRAYGEAGVTSAVSQGPVHMSGRPRDRLGTKLLAMLSAQSFALDQESGVDVMGGTVLLEPGLERSDFDEMYAAGVRLVAEVGVSGVHSVAELMPMVADARAAGLLISMHFGGPSISGSAGLGGAEAMMLRPDIVAHANGGSTSRSDSELADVVQSTGSYLEGCAHGNIRQLLSLVDMLSDKGGLGRLIFGSDSPSAIGMVPQAIWRLLTAVCSLGQVPVEYGVCAATGNAQRAFGLPAGTLTAGARADLLIVDAPQGGATKSLGSSVVHGDMPAIAGIMRSGSLRVGRPVNSPLALRSMSRDE